MDLFQANSFLQTPASFTSYKHCFSFNCIHKGESPNVYLIAELTDYIFARLTNYSGKITTAATHILIWSPKSKLSEMLKDAMCLHMARYISMYQIMLMYMLQIYITNSNSYCLSGFEKPHLFVWPTGFVFQISHKVLGRQFLKRFKKPKKTY